MDSRPVGRDAEIAEIWAFLSAASGTPAALVITGDAGIGKTVVWQHVLHAAARSYRVLSCRPAPAERPLAFSALEDLLGDVADEVLPELRMLLEHPQMSLTDEPIPLPRSLGGLMRRRVRRLTPEVRRVGRLVAASSNPRERLIRAACDEEESWATIDRAVDARPHRA